MKNDSKLYIYDKNLEESNHPKITITKIQFHCTNKLFEAHRKNIYIETVMFINIWTMERHLFFIHTREKKYGHCSDSVLL